MAQLTMIMILLVGMSTLVSSIFDDVERAKIAVFSDEIHNNNNGPVWCSVKYDDQDKNIVAGTCGEMYTSFLGELTESNRVYGFFRYIEGGQKKFAFLTWIGPGVKPLKKAKVSTDKAFVKDIFKPIGREYLFDEEDEVVSKLLKMAESS